MEKHTIKNLIELMEIQKSIKTIYSHFNKNSKEGL